MVVEQNELNEYLMGETLRELREERGLKRGWVSERADLSPRQVAAIELGEKKPSVDSLYRIIRCLGAPADRVFYPELTTPSSLLGDIMRLAATCSSKQQRYILGFIKMLKEQDGLDS